jgi:hypothetical protein
MEGQEIRRIRIKAGKKITDKTEIEKFAAEYAGGFLLGSGSNVEVIKADSSLYPVTDLYSKIRLFADEKQMNRNNIVVGPMGSGKTNLLENIIQAHPHANMIINDRKTEYVKKFYQPDKGDFLLGFPDERSVIWDIIEDIQQDPQCAELIFRNMLNSVRGESSEGQEWVTYAIKWLREVVDGVIQRLQEGMPRNEIPEAIVEITNACQVAVRDNKTGMSSDELSTAMPVIDLLFKMYYIGSADDRQFVTIPEIMAARRIFLWNHTGFSAVLDMHNNGLLAALVANYLGREGDFSGRPETYSYWILDEFLTFKLDKNSEENLFTLCRSKGIALFCGIQYLPPKDEERLSRMTASRYLTVAFKCGDEFSQSHLEKLSDQIEYQREVGGTDWNDGGLLDFKGGSMNVREQWETVQTHQITRSIIKNLPQYIACTEINDEKHGIVRTFILPVLVKAPIIAPGFIYSQAARLAPPIHKYLA